MSPLIALMEDQVQMLKVLGFAAVGQDIARATLLLVAYSLGLGLSFLVVGLAMGKLTRALDWFKRQSNAVMSK